MLSDTTRENTVFYGTRAIETLLCVQKKPCHLGTSVITVFRADIRKRRLKLYLLCLSIAVAR